jgi:hypothetical protein
MEERVKFARSQLRLLRRDANFFSRILFSDEAHFQLKGEINHQNFRYWSQTNPHWYREMPLHSPRITVWAAIGRRGVVGPVFIYGTVNGDNYLEMLKNRFLPIVEAWDDADTLIFQQDGATPHWKKTVRAWLDEEFPNRWIGRDSPNMPWAPYSPDLSPLDFFLWGWIRERVYRTEPLDLNDLQSRIQRAFDDLPQEMIDRAIDSYERRLRRCIEVEGKSVEQSYASDD